MTTEIGEGPLRRQLHFAVSRSAVPGNCWPAVPDIMGARMLALQYQLSESQWWSAERLLEAQFRQLSTLLVHARDAVPFYRERFASLDLSRGIDPASFAALPLLTRQDVQTGYELLLSARIPPAHGQTFDGETSGSTGRPIRFRTTELARFFWHAFTLRDHFWQQRDFAGKLAAIRSRVESATGQGWGISTDVAYRTGAVSMCNTELPISAQAQWLLRENPDYLISVASNARALARYCGEQGIRPPRLREVRTYGEALHPDMRSICRQAWGAPVVDAYSCREAGYLALQCPHHEHYHVQSEDVLLEVLDDDGRACQPGEFGQVVITPLHNFAMPLVRYAVGDYAEVGRPCPCGRGLPVLTRILGRVRNMLRLPNGETRWPRLGETGFRKIAPVLQFQVIQKSLSAIEINLVVSRTLAVAEEQQLREHVLQHLGYAFDISFVYRESLPRAKSGKYEEFRSEVSESNE